MPRRDVILNGCTAVLTPDLRALQKAGARHTIFERGARITSQGDAIKHVYFLKSGRVRTFYLYPDGHTITLSYWTAGAMIGLPAISSAGQRYLWSSEAAERTEALSLSIRRFQERMDTSTEFQRHILGHMELKLRHLSNISQMLAASSVVSRLGLALQSLCTLHGQPLNGKVSIELPLTHSDIANIVGASRQWVTQSIQRLRRAGIIEQGRRRTIVLRPDLLTDLSRILR